MTREDIVREARNAGFGEGIVDFIGLPVFERFAALVAAAERDKWMERTVILIHGEREACAKVCDDLTVTDGLHQAKYCANVIRARSNHG